jgi:hypothetical protein
MRFQDSINQFIGWDYMILQAWRQDSRVLTDKVNNVRVRSTFGEKKLKLWQYPFGGVAGK